MTEEISDSESLGSQDTESTEEVDVDTQLYHDYMKHFSLKQPHYCFRCLKRFKRVKGENYLCRDCDDYIDNDDPPILHVMITHARNLLRKLNSQEKN